MIPPFDEDPPTPADEAAAAPKKLSGHSWRDGVEAAYGHSSAPALVRTAGGALEILHRGTEMENVR